MGMLVFSGRYSLSLDRYASMKFPLKIARSAKVDAGFASDRAPTY
jgi:hypothetical protein